MNNAILFERIIKPPSQRREWTAFFYGLACALSIFCAMHRVSGAWASAPGSLRQETYGEELDESAVANRDGASHDWSNNEYEYQQFVVPIDPLLTDQSFVPWRPTVFMDRQVVGI